jgi:hypothetical protein
VVQPPDLPAGTDSRLVAAIRARYAREAAHRTYPAEWARLLPDTPAPDTLRRRWRPVGTERAWYEVELAGWRTHPDVAGALAAARALIDAEGGTLDERRWAESDGLWLRTTVAAQPVELYGTLTPPIVTLTVRSAPIAVPDDLARDLLAAGTEQVPTLPADD